jgi:hypothetical protein
VNRLRIVFAMAVLLLTGAAMAQAGSATEEAAAAPAAAAPSTEAASSTASTSSTTTTPQAQAQQTPGIFEKQPCPTPKIQHYRPTSQCGVDMFEPPKEETPEIPFEGLKLDWGAAFSQTYQSLKHRNTALPNIVAGVDQNQLINIGRGFDLAAANLYFNGQIADGVRLQLTMYLSSRHHNETWVKDGYILMDKLPFKTGLAHGLVDSMFEKFITVKVGHFEINYGDEHFRRTDNGEGMYNPFIGNYLLDSFTTEIGGEVYIRSNGIMVMGSMTGGEIKGNVLTPSKRRPAFITKIGFDRQVTPDLRVRLTASNYTIRKSPSDTLYGGDRGGSPYFCVMESAATGCGTAQAFSGDINPGFSYRVMAFQVNPFVKYKGLEFFGVLEHAKGSTATETQNRIWTQFGGEGVYRFAGDHLYLGARYDIAKGNFAGIVNQVSVNRTQFAAGWYLIRYLLLKTEYVIQNYKNFPPTDIRNGGRFQGTMVDAVLAF